MRRLSTILLGSVAATLAIVGLAIGAARTQAVTSGVKIGGMLGSFYPTHVTGADRGNRVCPICQYPTNPAVQVWINGDDENNIAAIAALLEKATVAHKPSKFKAFLVYYNVPDGSQSALNKHLKEFAASNNLNNVALVIEQSSDLNGIRDNEINNDVRVKNTVLVYKACKVTTKFVNFRAGKPGLDALLTAISGVVK